MRTQFQVTSGQIAKSHGQNLFATDRQKFSFPTTVIVPLRIHCIKFSFQLVQIVILCSHKGVVTRARNEVYQDGCLLVCCAV
jgi:hypothetical protein